MPARTILSCPANYFGRGENFVLPDDAAFIKEFEDQWATWEREHPDDPTGELALEAAKKNHIQIAPSPPRPAPVVIGIAEKNLEYVENDRRIFLKLTLPHAHMQKLKNFARLQRRRPRDIIIAWIEKLCRL